MFIALICVQNSGTTSLIFSPYIFPSLIFSQSQKIKEHREKIYAYGPAGSKIGEEQQFENKLGFGPGF